MPIDQQVEQKEMQITQRYHAQLLAPNQMEYRQTAERVQQATQFIREIQEKQLIMPIHQ